MNSGKARRRSVLVGAASAAAAASIMVLPARASTIHEYEFYNNSGADTGTQNDGSSNAMPINGATITGGALVTNGNAAGAGKGVNAPQAQLSGFDTIAGLSADFSIESYFTRDPAATNNYSTLYSFSDSTTNNYFLATSGRGGTDANLNHFSLAVKSAATNGKAEYLLVGPILAAGSSDVAVGSFNSTTGVMSLFVNGAVVAQTPAGTETGFNLSTNDLQDGINGSSPFTGDLATTGSTSDFRINDNQISVAQAAINYLAGPTNAAVVTTNGTANGDYNTGGYDNGAPTASTIAVINNTKTLSSGTGAAGLLRVANAATLNVNGGTLSVATDLDLIGGSTVNLNGGTLSLRGITSDGDILSTSPGTHTINLNGGTLQNAANSQLFAPQSNVTMNVQSASTIDPNGNSISLGSTFTGTGALTKIGTPTLTVTGDTSGFSGALNATAGSLVLSSSVGRSGAAAYANPITVSAGSLTVTGANPADFTGALSDIGGTLTLSNTSTAADNVGGTVNVNGGNLIVSNTGVTTLAGMVTTTGDIQRNGAANLYIAGGATVGGNIGLNGAGGTPATPRVLQFSSNVSESAAGVTAGKFTYEDQGGNSDVQYTELTNNVTVSTGLLFVKGRGGQTGTSAPLNGLVLGNLSGNNTYAGGIRIDNGGGVYSIRSQAGTLTVGTSGVTGNVAGNVFNNVSGGDRGFELTGPGNGIFAGAVIDDGTGLTSLSMIGETAGATTTGNGTWSLNNSANNLSGGINVVSGHFFVNGATTSTSTATTNIVSVYGGTLGGTGSIAQATTIFNVGTTTPTFSTYTGTTSLGGSIDPGNATTPIGKLTLGNALTVNGNVSEEYDGTGAGSADDLSVAGALTLGSTSSLTLTDLNVSANDPAYVLAQYGSLSGTFGSATTVPGYTLNYAYNGKQIALVATSAVPEPATLSVIAFGGLLAAKRRRRV